MKINDLRLGNIVCWTEDPDWSPMTIVGINLSGGIFARYDYGDGTNDTREYDIQDVCSIILTEKWLLDFGFEKRGDFYHKEILNDWTKIYFNLTHGNICEISVNRHSCVIKCENVNQLQNLFYSITGEELEPK
jgi:hypothetical protein